MAPRGAPKVDAHVDQISGKNNKDKSEWNRNKYDALENHQHHFYGGTSCLGNLWESLEEPSDHTWSRQAGSMNLDFQKAFGQELSSKVLKRLSCHEIKVTTFRWMDTQ